MPKQAKIPTKKHKNLGNATVESHKPKRFEFTGAVPVPRSAKIDFEEVKSEDRKVSERDAGPQALHASLLSSAPRLNMAFAGYTPLPSRLQVRMKYVSEVVLTGSVTPGVHVFSANGLYDPDITGTGHQPRGFDQLIALYDHYIVLNSHIWMQTTLPTVASVVITGIELQSSSTTQSDYIDYAEQPRCDFAVDAAFNTSGGLPEPPRRHMDFSARKFMGIPDPMTATKLQGSVGANPADQAFFHCFAQSYDGSSGISTYGIVSIEYDAVFIEPVPVASS